MRYGEDNYEDGFLGLEPFMPMAQPMAAQPMGGLTAAAEPAPYSTPALTPEFLQQLQQGAAAVGNAAQSGALSNMFAPGTLSQFDPLYDYAKTAPILSLKGNKEYENLNFQALPGTNYQLTVGGQVVGSASNPQEVAALVNQANAISEQGGKAVDVRLQKEVQAATRTGEPITAFEDVYANRPNDNGFLDIAIPAALAVMGGAALGPLLGGTTAAGKVGLLGASKLAGAAGAGLGSAAGSFAGSMGTGANLEEALIKAGISGLTAGALKGVMPGGAGDAAAGKVAAVAPGYDIAVAPAVPGLGGTTLALPAFASPFTGVGAGLVTQALPAGTKINEFGALVDSTTGAPTGSLGFSLDLPYIDDVLASMPNFGAAAPLASAASSVPGDLVVTGLRTGASALPAVASALPAVANIVGAQEVLGNQPTTPREETTVTGNRIYDQAPTGPLAAIADAVAAAQLAPAAETMQTVTQQRPEDVAPPSLYVPPIETLPTFEAPFTGADVGPLPTEEPTQTVTQQRPQDIAPPSLYVPPTGGLPTFEAPPTVFDSGPLPAEEPTQTVTQQRPQDIAPPSLYVPPMETLPAFEAPPTVFDSGPLPTEEPTQTVTQQRPEDVAPPAADLVRNIVGAAEALGNQPATAAEEALVTGKFMDDTNIGGGLPAAVGAVAAEPTLLTKDITVTQQRPQDAAPPPPITAVSDVVTKYAPSKPAESLIEKQAKKIDDADPITVTAEPIKATGSLGAALPGLAMTLPAMTAAQAISTTAATPPAKKGMSTIGKVTGGLAILDALGNLLGGGGGGGGGGQVGLESLNPIFRAQLPTPRGQFAPQALAQRQPGEGGRPPIDYARYGYGPARSFFNYVPETEAERAAFATAAAPAPRTGVGTVMPQAVPGAAEPTGATDSVLRAGFEQLRAAMPGASDAELIAFLGTPEGQQELADIFERLGAKPRAKGGKMGGSGQSQESFAVNGAGTGRSDEIPALLSDGEYVIDAETVALLGDGSGKAGAKRLDDFRVNIRKHKGRNLAKGKFSVNAKRPERYLSGGRV
jgi:hypothetical protein